MQSHVSAPHYHGSTWKPGAAIHHGDWKLIEFYHDEKVELYHLADDLGERYDQSEAKPIMTRRLRDQLRTWQDELGAKMPVPIAPTDP